MLTLICDTSHARGRIVLYQVDPGAEPLFLESLDSQPVAENLVADIYSLVCRHQFTLADLERYAVTIGPGSFTGLRVGLTVMKTLASIHSKPLIGLPTLEAMALSIHSQQRPLLSSLASDLELSASDSIVLVPVLAAALGEFYCGFYSADLDAATPLNQLYADRCLSARELSEICADHERKHGTSRWIYCGSGYERLDPEQLTPTSIVLSTKQMQPAAHALLELGERAFASGVKPLATTAQPVYLRLSEAERKLRHTVHYESLQ